MSKIFIVGTALAAAIIPLMRVDRLAEGRLDQMVRFKPRLITEPLSS